MSCYEWEEGSFKLSCKEWPKFKKRFRDAWNASLEKAYDHACDLQKRALAAKKGKRNVYWFDVLRDLKVETSGGWGLSGYHGAYKNTFDLDHHHLITRSMGYDGVSTWKTRPLKPKKKDFPKVTNKTMRFERGDACVLFHDKQRSVTWLVPENNHACDAARESILGRVFFGALEKVEWSRGTGGEIVGNDEYSTDDHSVGGGGNYSKGKWGPKEQKAQRAAAARRW